jgi:hypothetical protein
MLHSLKLLLRLRLPWEWLQLLKRQRKLLHRCYRKKHYSKRLLMLLSKRLLMRLQTLPRMRRLLQQQFRQQQKTPPRQKLPRMRQLRLLLRLHQ